MTIITITINPITQNPTPKQEIFSPILATFILFARNPRGEFFILGSCCAADDDGDDNSDDEDAAAAVFPSLESTNADPW